MMFVRRAVRMRMYIYLLVVCFLSNDIDLIILPVVHVDQVVSVVISTIVESFSHRWHFLLHRQMLITSLHIDDLLSVHFFFFFFLSVCVCFFLFHFDLHLLRSLLPAARCWPRHRGEHYRFCSHISFNSSTQQHCWASAGCHSDIVYACSYVLYIYFVWSIWFDSFLIFFSFFLRSTFFFFLSRIPCAGFSSFIETQWWFNSRTERGPFRFVIYDDGGE